MNRTAKLLLSAGAIGLGATVLAGAGFAHGDCGHHHGRGSAGGYGSGLLDQFDTNGDGKVTQDEIDQARQSRFAEFDKNGDGKLSLDEYQVLWMDAMRERMVRSFQDADRDGDASVTTVEYTERVSHLVTRLDRNGDGAVTQEDMRRPGRADADRDQPR